MARITGLSNARFDELVTVAAAENGIQLRLDTMAEAERELLNNYAVIPLYFYVTKHLVKPWVIGYRPNALDHDRTQYYRIERP
jgi:ABC-type oligopeptide transport system substrate-binding subunit